MKLVILGNVPSQKNRKIISRNRSTNRPFLRSAPAVKSWQSDAAIQLASQFDGTMTFDYPLTISLVFYFDNKRRHDLDNALSTVMDALAAARKTEMVRNRAGQLVKRGVKGSGIIPDDSVEYVECVTIQYGGFDKLNPRVEIYIDE